MKIGTLIKMKTILLSILIILLFLPAIFAQNTQDVTYIRIIDGDTIPVYQLKEVNVTAYRVVSKKEFRRMNRLIRNVKKVYPYAEIAGYKYREYNALLEKTSDKKEQRRIIKKAEKELKAEFGHDLRKLTFSQGRILIKLIDRETGDTSFDLVKELRGGFPAFFYQGFARLFGYNLKTDYDAKGADSQIELIVRMIKNGSI
ncbi:MAG: DUF4294 domain-containing protein [Bacteroidetes bacterium]|nr:DUF4294 domain-containing protein [Bacteroidota bacterium]